MGKPQVIKLFFMLDLNEHDIYRAQHLLASYYSMCPLVREKSGKFVFLQGQGKVREFSKKMSSKIRKSSKVREF